MNEPVVNGEYHEKQFCDYGIPSDCVPLISVAKIGTRLLGVIDSIQNGLKNPG